MPTIPAISVRHNATLVTRSPGQPVHYTTHAITSSRYPSLTPDVPPQRLGGPPI